MRTTIENSERETTSQKSLSYVAESQAQLGLVSLCLTLNSERLNSEQDDARSGRYWVSSDFQVSIELVGSAETIHARMPCQIDAQQSGLLPIAPTADHIPLRLRCAGDSPAPSTTGGLPSSYLSCDHIRRVAPDHLCCAHCAAPLIKSHEAPRYQAMPSEHWEELIDSWMCHADQLLNASVTRGKEGLEDSKQLKDDEVRVSDTSVTWSSERVVHGALRDRPLQVSLT